MAETSGSNVVAEKSNVAAYTDGACSGNPGPGGWGVVLLYNDQRKELSGYEPNTTNNRMELQAVIAALSALRRPCNVDVYSDSAYVVRAFTQRWLQIWQRNGWKTASKQPVLNQDLWQELIGLCNMHKVTFNKVHGHANDRENNRCDELARRVIQENR